MISELLMESVGLLPQRAIGAVRKRVVQMIADEPVTVEIIPTVFPASKFPAAEYVHARKAWRCVLCAEWQEFETLTVNGRSQIVKGRGGSSTIYRGGRIDHCRSANCCRQAEELLGIET